MRAAWQDDARGSGFAMPRLTSAVKALLIANIALFVVQELVLQGEWSESVTAPLLLQPEQWTAWFPFVPLWQLVSYGFFHGNIPHLLYNMLALYFLGTMLEEEIGSRRFLVFYLVAVAAAGLCQLVVGLALGMVGPILGASGGVLAIVCAMATLRPTLRLIFIIVPMTLRTLALIYVGLDLFSAIKQLQGEISGTANFAHLTGALIGFLAVRRRWIWGDPLAVLRSWRERRSSARGVTDEARLDELLQKINREGIHALSSRERAFLKRVSGRR